MHRLKVAFGLSALVVVSFGAGLLTGKGRYSEGREPNYLGCAELSIPESADPDSISVGILTARSLEEAKERHPEWFSYRRGYHTIEMRKDAGGEPDFFVYFKGDFDVKRFGACSEPEFDTTAI